jgi:agmatine deiminase
MTAPTLTTPRADGFRMPAEWEAHDGTWMIWPERPDNWRLGARPAQAAFTAVASAIARFEPLTMLVSAAQMVTARAALPPAVRVIEAESDDAWARDVGATFVTDAAGELRGVDWTFNAWGGREHGLYFPWDRDDAIAATMLAIEGAPRYRTAFVTEGGALHVDGEGTVLVTEACLLDEHRNPGIMRAAAEEALTAYLGASTVVWLGAGVPFDETGGHVDNLACFVRPGVVLLTWCDDPADPHYAVSRDAEARLLASRDARGRELTVERIPMPVPMYSTAEETDGVEHGATGYTRRPGDRLAGSYVNFLIVNGAVIAPQFASATDEPARDVLAHCFPDREIVMVPGREILLGGGNIHCITQQQPRRG